MDGHQFGYKQKFLTKNNDSSFTASHFTWQLRGLFTNYECTQSHVLLSPCPEAQPLRLHVNGKTWPTVGKKAYVETTWHGQAYSVFFAWLLKYNPGCKGVRE